jgi:hypothetical protein
MIQTFIGPYKEKTNIIRLPDIENGSDKFQIRIWQETGKGELVLLIIHEDNGWSAKSYIYEATSVHGLNNLDSFIVKTISLGSRNQAGVSF